MSTDYITREAALEAIATKAREELADANHYVLQGYQEAIEAVENAPSAWHEYIKGDHTTCPDSDRMVLASLSNCTGALLAQWRDWPFGWDWYQGDTDETFAEYGLYVDGWWELPEKPGKGTE